MTGGGAPIRIWAVSDGRVGIEAQVQGLAEAVARQRPSLVVDKRVSARGLTAVLPPRLSLATPRGELICVSNPASRSGWSLRCVAWM